MADQGAKVVPALIEFVKSDKKLYRHYALRVLGTYPKEAVEHLDLFIGILDGEGTANERIGAASLVGRIAPKDDRYEKALKDAHAAATGSLKQSFANALNSYRRRHKLPGDGS